jgi:hypothetical protein
MNPTPPQPQGVDAYLMSCGLSPSEIDSIRAALMTPEALAALRARGGTRGWPTAAAGGGGAEEGRVRAAVEEAKAATAATGRQSGGGAA